MRLTLHYLHLWNLRFGVLQVVCRNPLRCAGLAFSVNRLFDHVVVLMNSKSCWNSASEYPAHLPSVNAYMSSTLCEYDVIMIDNIGLLRGKECCRTHPGSSCMSVDESSFGSSKTLL